MSKPDDLRLIEDYLPIEAISAEASREKSVRKGHISTLHLWWARRPLVACRAAVYGALVPADRWVKEVELKAPPADAAKAEKVKNGKKKGLNRKAAKEFVTKLCRYPKTNPTKPEDVRIKQETEAAIVEAQRHILEAHADRLTAELAEAQSTGERPAWAEEFKFSAKKVTYDDIVAGRAPRPRVLDMFAGGGAIPLEALRLGCEAYALDLNPVAHIIELCTLVYPQKYGKPDPHSPGMTGPKDANGETTWGGLASEVRHWGHWVLERVRKQIGDLYPPIPDPEVWAAPPEIAFDRESGAWKVIKEGKMKDGVHLDAPATSAPLLPDDGSDDFEEVIGGNAASGLPLGFVQPVAYLWTRTVRCKNPGCAATVPLVKRTWMRQKAGDLVALDTVLNQSRRHVDFCVKSAEKRDFLGFDPAAFSTSGNASCHFCGTVADSDYVKSEGVTGRIGHQLMAVACSRTHGKGKFYITPSEVSNSPDLQMLTDRLNRACQGYGITPPSEPITDDAKNSFWVRLYGFTNFGQIFTPRQLVFLITLVGEVRGMPTQGCAPDGGDIALLTILAAMIDRLADFSSSLCVWNSLEGERTAHTFGRQGLPMTWDYSEVAPLNIDNAGWPMAVARIVAALESINFQNTAIVNRASATSLAFATESLDAVVTDPPYYDNVSYADLSDFFYVWLKRVIGDVYPEHFATDTTPKKSEAVADAVRHSNSKEKARTAYEAMMAQTFVEANRVLKPCAPMSVVYAHKTTLG